jgi:SAM-dependent methyltransferase
MTTISTCPICEGHHFTSELTCTDYTVSKRQFDIIQCSSCTLRITSPRPDDIEIGKYYLSENYISHAPRAKSIIDRTYLVARKYALHWKENIIEKVSPTARRKLLDYGCGTGSFLIHMKNAGWDAHGLEPSPLARAVIRKQASIDIHEDLSSLTDKDFDVITLWHVLEHVPNPNEVVRELASKLIEGGSLLVALPNHLSWDGKRYKSHWAGYDVPRHLWHFSQTTMNKLVHKHGLRIAEVIPMKLDAYYISLLSEKYQGNNAITASIKAIVNGTRSNYQAKTTTEYSSLIYIIKK